MESVVEEFMNMFDNEEWELVKRPKNTKILKTKWAFKTKMDETEEPARFKVRLMVLGNLQRPGIDYDNTFNPCG